MKTGQDQSYSTSEGQLDSQSWCRAPLKANNQITVQLNDDMAPSRAGWAGMEEEGPRIRAGKAPEEEHERAWRQDGKGHRARVDPWRRVGQEQCRQPSVKTKTFVTMYIYVCVCVCVHAHLFRNSYRTQSASIVKVNAVQKIKYVPHKKKTQHASITKTNMRMLYKIFSSYLTKNTVCFHQIQHQIN